MNLPDLTPPQSHTVFWRTGIPPVSPGGRKTFWCAVRGVDGNIRHCHLVYLNSYIMRLADSCYEAPKSAVPVGDDGEYAWTGWHEESCDQCETQWAFDDNSVIAWMSLPKYSDETSGWKS